MPQVLTVPGSEMDISTPAKGVPINGNAIASSRYQGAMAIAGATEQIGEQFQGLSDQLMKARNAGIAADVDLKMRTARQSFLESLKNDPTETNWTERAAQTATQVRDDIDSAHEKVPPGMRRQVETAFKSWRGSLLLETQTLANVQTVNRAWGKTQEDIREKLKDGDAIGAMHSIQLARSTKIADPAELDQIERDIPKTIARNYIENGLAANPKGTADMLKSGASLPAVDQNGKLIVPKKVFSPKEMDQLMNTARVRTAAWQRGNFEELLKNQTDPVTGFVDESAIREGMASGEIEEKTGRNLIAAQDRKLKETNRAEALALKVEDTNRHAVVTAKIHDPSAWSADPDGYAHEMTQEAASITDPALRQRALNDVQRQLIALKKTGETAEKPIERQMIQLMNADRQTQGVMVPMGVQDIPASSHWFRADEKAKTSYTAVAGGLGAINKMDETEIKANFGDNATKDSVIEAINIHSARLQSQMRDWFKTPEGEKATFDQANDHRKKLEQPFVMEAVRASLSKRIPVNVTTQEEFEALPAGAPFTWNGRIGTKN